MTLPQVENVLAVGNTALVVDVDPITGVTLAARLCEERLAHAVLVLPRWPHPNAVLPCQELHAVLTRCAPTLPRDLSAHNVVFVLDGERTKTLHDRPRGDPRVDNRYDLSVADLPTLAALSRAGITRIVKLTQAA